MILDFLRSAYDHSLGKPKTAFPTRFHYVEVLRDALAANNIEISRLGQHCLMLTDKSESKRLIVIVRYTTDRDLKFISRLKSESGVRVAYLIDDDIWAMREDVGLKADYRTRIDGFLKAFFNRLYPLLDAVVAPSRQILMRLPKLQGVLMQPVHLSPSGNFGHFNYPGQVRLVFLGSSTHGTDFLNVVPGIAAALKSNSRLHLTTFLGKRGGEILEAGPQVTHMADMFFPRFQSWLSCQNFHIGLAPYEPNTVNDGRSNLKFHQHALVSAAGIYSETVPFLNSVVHEKNGLLLKHRSDVWQEGINMLAGDLRLARSLAEAGVATSVRMGSHGLAASKWKNLL